MGVNSAFKLLYNRAFRAPTIAELYSASGGAPDLDPETLDSYELVFLTQRGAWNTEIVLFENHWEDGIVLVIDSSLPEGFQNLNVGLNEAQVIEVSRTWLSHSWRVDVSGSYVKSKNLETNEDYELSPNITLCKRSGSESRGPGPLKIIATEVPGHIDHFTDEI